MSDPVPLPLHELPAKHGAREQASRLVQRAARARVRLHDAEDSEALHDFRVAVRRLRTFLRAYEPWLELGRKTTRRLRDLARATGETRDSEVGVEWLETHGRSLNPRQRVGLRWFVERLQRRRRSGYDKLRARVPARWIKLEARLRRHLDSPFSDELNTETFGQVSAILLVDQVARLEERLAAVVSIDDPEPAHRARIDAKRVRYLLEPFKDVAPDAKTALRQLRRLQDAFGELNDAHVMLARLRKAAAAAAARRARRLFDLGLDPATEPRDLRRVRGRAEQPGLLELARIAAAEREARFRQIDEECLQGRARPLLDRVRQVAELLARPARAPLRLVPQANGTTDPSPESAE